LAHGGQSDSLKTLGVEGSVHYGFLIAHHPKMVHLQTGNVKGMELEFSKKMNGSKPWNHYFNFPTQGISIGYWSLANENYLGNIIAVVPYIDFPLFSGSKVQLNFKFGVGLGYVSKTFDAKENYKNNAIGSHFNGNILLHPTLVFPIGKNLIFKTGPAVTHFSNASVAVPNLGLNLMTWKGTIKYQLGNYKPKSAREIVPFTKNTWWFIYATGSIKEIYPPEGPKYWAMTIGAERMKRFSPKSAWGFGADYFYDESMHQKFDERDIETSSKLDASRLGVKLGYELLLDRVSLIFNTGFYLYSKLNNDGRIYSRIGMRYHLSNRFSGVLQLKTHFGKADFMEVGLGYRINRK